MTFFDSVSTTALVFAAIYIVHLGTISIWGGDDD